MYYYAYGSNMEKARLEQRLGQVIDLGIGIAEGFQILFNKESSLDGTGKTNIIPIADDLVLGVVFDLTEEQFTILDRNEGGYHRDTVEVNLNGTYVIAQTYFANPNRINNNLIPTRDYLAHLINGAIEHNFPQFYLDKLNGIVTS